MIEVYQQILIYDILQGALSENHQENFTELSKLGFLTNQDYCLTDSLQKIWEFIKKFLQKEMGFLLELMELFVESIKFLKEKY